MVTSHIIKVRFSAIFCWNCFKCLDFLNTVAESYYNHLKNNHILHRKDVFDFSSLKNLIQAEEILTGKTFPARIKC